MTSIAWALAKAVGLGLAVLAVSIIVLTVLERMEGRGKESPLDGNGEGHDVPRSWMDGPRDLLDRLVDTDGDDGEDEGILDWEEIWRPAAFLVFLRRTLYGAIKYIVRTTAGKAVYVVLLLFTPWVKKGVSGGEDGDADSGEEGEEDDEDEDENGGHLDSFAAGVLTRMILGDGGESDDDSDDDEEGNVAGILGKILLGGAAVGGSLKAASHVIRSRKKRKGGRSSLAVKKEDDVATSGTTPKHITIGCIAALRRLRKRGLITAEVQSVLLTDIIVCKAKGEATSVAEVAYELLLCGEEVGECRETAEGEFVQQCQVLSRLCYPRYYTDLPPENDATAEGGDACKMPVSDGDDAATTKGGEMHATSINAKRGDATMGGKGGGKARTLSVNDKTRDATFCTHQ